jgi:hypothetical protein
MQGRGVITGYGPEVDPAGMLIRNHPVTVVTSETLGAGVSGVDCGSSDSGDGSRGAACLGGGQGTGRRPGAAP